MRTDANLQGDPESPPLKTETVEDWALVAVGGVTSAYRIRVERGEKAIVVTNAIDNSISAIQFLLKDNTEKNETVGTICFNFHNLISFSKSAGTAPIYGKGESPEEKEMARLEDLRKSREERFKSRQDAIDADYEREMNDKGKS